MKVKRPLICQFPYRTKELATYTHTHTQPDCHAVFQVAEASSAALQAAAAATQTALEAAGTAVAAGDSSFQEASATTTNSIKDRLEAMLAPPPPPSITVSVSD